jgi:tRNA(Ile)-lysidine synthase
MENLIKFINKYDLLSNKDKVVVGVSGGVDSVFLLDILNRYLKKENIIIAHINHSFREESNEEFEFVRSLSVKYGNVFEGIKIDVTKYKEDNNLSSQVASRECRYEFYENVMSNHGINKLILGHHGDDLVETILMRQVNGSTNKGIIGIKMKRNFNNKEIIRPLLCLSKEEIYEEAKKLKLEYREDMSNFTDVYIRNRIRNHVLPKLKDENKKMHEKFLSQSIERQEDEDFFTDIVNEFIEEKLVIKTSSVEIKKEEFNKLHSSIKRRLISVLLSNFNIHSLDSGILDKLNEKIKKDSSSDYNELIKNVYVVNDYEKFHIFYSEGNLPNNVGKITIYGNKVCKDDLEIIKLSTDDSVKIRKIKDGDRLFYNGINRRVVSILAKKKIAVAFRKESLVIEVNGDIKALLCGNLLIK